MCEYAAYKEFWASCSKQEVRQARQSLQLPGRTEKNVRASASELPRNFHAGNMSAATSPASPQVAVDILFRGDRRKILCVGTDTKGPRGLTTPICRSMLFDVTVFQIKNVHVHLLCEIILKLAPITHVDSATATMDWGTLHRIVWNFECDGAAPFAVEFVVQASAHDQSLEI